MAKSRKIKTASQSDGFPSNFPVPVHTGDYWKRTQHIVNHAGITGWDAPDHEPHSDEARAEAIRALPGADLQAFCTPAELAGELSRRQYFAQMNQTELDFQSTFDPDAAAEAKRRTGVYPR